MIKLFYRALVIVALLLAAGSAVFLWGFRRMVPQPQAGAYQLRIKSYPEFIKLRGAPLSNKFNDVYSVKVVYDIHDERLYFINSSAYRFHYDFVHNVLMNEESLHVFNMLNYGTSLQRQYILANINLYRGSRIYALEFSSDDQVSPQQVGFLLKEVKSKTYIGDSLKLLVGSDRMLEMDNTGKLALPKVYPADIYKGQKFQSLNNGVCYGILRDGTTHDKTNYKGDVVLLKGTPVDVPVCAGLITNSFQTPLSHINVLCHNRNIPSAVQTDVFTNPAIKANIGKPVKMEVTNEGVAITAISMQTLDSLRQKTGAVKTVALVFDTTVKRLLPADSFSIKQKNIVGNKAAGLGELARIARKQSAHFRVPEGAFAIPFYFYYQHISAPEIRWKINDLVKMQQGNAGEEQLKAQLKLIRKAIKDMPLNKDLQAAIVALMQKNGTKSCRFRSSANAEDVEGFSGAGLYESRTGKLSDKDKPIDEAIKKVWASVYNDNAYFERVSAGIDERTMMMGILVHRNFPDEAANGVAITTNLYRPTFPGFTINVQAGETPVVSPPDSVSCDQFVCVEGSVINPLDNDIAVDYISYSNISGNKRVLDHRQIQILFHSLALIKNHFLYLNRLTGDKRSVILDMEFKFDKSNRLYIKQVRPYR